MLKNDHLSVYLHRETQTMISFSGQHDVLTIGKFSLAFSFPETLHIKKLMGMHDISVYTKYMRIIRVCVVWIYLS